jgi:two-component system, OmpR family, sensor kinase
MRRWMLWTAAAYLGVLVVVAAGLALLYGGARTRLDDALGQRLVAVATTASYLVEGDRLADWSFDPEPATDLLWLQSRCEQIRRENDLAEVTLCGSDGYVVLSATGRLARGELDVFWDVDRPAVEQARSGAAAASRLYRQGALVQKAAYAPVLDSQGEVVGVLTVEGSADFFDALANLRRGAWLTSVAVLVFLGGLGLLLARLHLSLEHSRDQLARQENLAAMGRLTAGIAHEIRNPLGIIRGAGQHLQRVLAERGVADEVAAFIPEEVDRLDRILTGYLAFGADAPVEPEDVDLAQLARRTARLLESELRAGGVTVRVAEPLPSARLRGDPRRLQQVLLNLLLNARDAMPGGGEVVLALASEGGRHCLTVTDAGEGLEAGARERAFDPFWTTKEKGSGLGLAVSRRLAREHGGDLTLADRADGRGCVARLELPADPERRS